MAPKIKRLLLKSSWYRGRLRAAHLGLGEALVGVRLPPPIVLVLVLVVVLGLPARKAIDDDHDDHDDDNGKRREFLDRPRGRRRPRSAG